MLTLLGGDPEFTEPSSVPIPEALQQLLNDGFEQKGEFTFVRSLASSRSSTFAFLKQTDDATGIEAAINEIHVDDFVPEAIPFFELVRLGSDFGFALRKKLNDAGLNGPFRVIVSACSADPSLNVRNTCVVRFHKRRIDQSWLNDDLESYKEEAVEVLDS